MHVRLDARLAAVALSVVFVAAGSTAAHAVVPAPGQLEVAIASPEAGSVFHGMTPVIVHISGDGTATPTRVQVTMTGIEPGQERSGTVVDLDPSCAIECDVTVTVDTMSWHDPGDDPEALPDILGNRARRDVTSLETSTVATVDADTPLGTITATSPTVLLYARELIGYGTAGVNQGLETDAQGRRWTAMYWDIAQWRLPASTHLVGTLFGNGPRQDFTISPTLVGGSYRYTMAVDPDLPDGSYPLRLAVVDELNNTYAYMMSAVAAYNGPRVTKIASLNGVVPDPAGNDGAQLVVHASATPYYPYAPKSFAVTIDGKLTEPRTYTYDQSAGTFTMLASAPGGGRLTVGPHTVRVDYTEVVFEGDHPSDTRTETASWEGTATTAGVTITPKVTGPVVEGVSGTLTVTLTATDGTGTPAPQVRSWRITDNYSAKLVVLGSGTCTGNCATATAAASLKGLVGARPGSLDRDHYLQVEVTDSTGVTRATTVRVGVDPLPRTTIVAPPRAPYGAKVKLVAVTQAKSNDGLPAVPVTFQARVGGTSTWRTVATATTNRDGLATAYVTVTQNVQWRFLATQRVGYNGPATSAIVGTVVPAKAVLSGTPASGTANRAYRVATTVYPRTSARAVYVQVRKYGTSRWVTVTSSATDKSGVARATMRLGRGTWAVRLYVRGVASSAATYSPSAKTVMR